MKMRVREQKKFPAAVGGDFYLLSLGLCLVKSRRGPHQVRAESHLSSSDSKHLSLPRFVNLLRRVVGLLSETNANQTHGQSFIPVLLHLIGLCF